MRSNRQASSSAYPPAITAPADCGVIPAPALRQLTFTEGPQHDVGGWCQLAAFSTGHHSAPCSLTQIAPESCDDSSSGASCSEREDEGRGQAPKRARVLQLPDASADVILKPGRGPSLQHPTFAQPLPAIDGSAVAEPLRFQAGQCVSVQRCGQCGDGSSNGDESCSTISSSSSGGDDGSKEQGWEAFTAGTLGVANHVLVQHCIEDPEHGHSSKRVRMSPELPPAAQLQAVPSPDGPVDPAELTRQLQHQPPADPHQSWACKAPGPIDLVMRVAAYSSAVRASSSSAVARAVIAHAGLPPAGGYITVWAAGQEHKLLVRMPARNEKPCQFSATGSLLQALRGVCGDLVRLAPLPGGAFAATLERDGSAPHGGAQQPGTAAGTRHQLPAVAFTLGKVNCSADEARAMLRHAGHPISKKQGALRCWIGAAGANAGPAAAFLPQAAVTHNCFQAECGYLQNLVPLLRTLGARAGDVLHLQPQPDGSFRATCVSISQQPAWQPPQPRPGQELHQLPQLSAAASSAVPPRLVQHTAAPAPYDAPTLAHAVIAPHPASVRQLGHTASCGTGGSASTCVRDAAKEEATGSGASDADVRLDSIAHEAQPRPAVSCLQLPRAVEQVSELLAPSDGGGSAAGDLIARVSQTQSVMYVSCSREAASALIAHAGLPPSGGALALVAAGGRHTALLRVYVHGNVSSKLVQVSKALRALGGARGDLVRLSLLPGGAVAAILEPSSCQREARSHPASFLRLLRSSGVSQGEIGCSVAQARAMLLHARHGEGADCGVLRCRVEPGPGCTAAEYQAQAVVRKVGLMKEYGCLRGLQPLLRALGARPGDWLRLEPLPDGSFRAVASVAGGDQPPPQQQQQGSQPWPTQPPGHGLWPTAAANIAPGAQRGAAALPGPLVAADPVVPLGLGAVTHISQRRRRADDGEAEDAATRLKRSRQAALSGSAECHKAGSPSAQPAGPGGAAHPSSALGFAASADQQPVVPAGVAAGGAGPGAAGALHAQETGQPTALAGTTTGMAVAAAAPLQPPAARSAAATALQPETAAALGALPAGPALVPAAPLSAGPQPYRGPKLPPRRLPAASARVGSPFVAAAACRSAPPALDVQLPAAPAIAATAAGAATLPNGLGQLPAAPRRSGPAGPPAAAPAPAPAAPAPRLQGLRPAAAPAPKPKSNGGLLPSGGSSGSITLGSSLAPSGGSSGGLAPAGGSGSSSGRLQGLKGSSYVPLGGLGLGLGLGLRRGPGPAQAAAEIAAAVEPRS